MKNPKSSDYVLKGLLVANKAVADLFKADVIFLRAPLLLGIDDVVRDYIENLPSSAPKGGKWNKLCVLLETNGGYIEVVERIYSVFRKHYQEVVFVVPNFAYSAGTVLVLSGDEIYMDYYSVLGPIDPQIDGEDGATVPGIGYLQKFDELLKEINNDPTGGEKTRAQLAYLIRRFDPAKLFFVEQARDHAIQLLEAWLPKHKFKDWTVTNSRKLQVTKEMKDARATEIAEILGKPDRWHSHGRGIGLQELQADEIKLVIKNFGDDANLNKAIRSYYDLLIDYLGKLQLSYAIHGLNGIRSVE